MCIRHIDTQLIDHLGAISNIVSTPSNSSALEHNTLRSNQILSRSPRIAQEYTNVELAVCFKSIVLIRLELKVNDLCKTYLSNFASMRCYPLISRSPIAPNTKLVEDVGAERYKPRK